MSNNFTAQEQVVDDSTISGLILTFQGVRGNLCKLSVECLALPHMNRDFYFAADGSFDGKGTFLGGSGIDFDPGDLSPSPEPTEEGR